MSESRVTADTQASRSTTAEPQRKRASAVASCVLPVPPIPASGNLPAAWGWVGGVSTTVSPGAGLIAMSNPVSGRRLKRSASGGTVPERTGQRSGCGRWSAGLSSLTWLFMVTLAPQNFLRVASARLRRSVGG